MNFDENTKRLKQCQAVSTIIHSNRLFEKFNKKDVHNKQSNSACDFLKITEMWVRTLLFSGREFKTSLCDSCTDLIPYNRYRITLIISKKNKFSKAEMYK